MTGKENKKTSRTPRRFKGVVVSAAMNKTAVVKVISIKIHPKYRKRYQVMKKYQAHDEKNEYKVNESVVIEEVRPISKLKKWRVIGKVNEKI